MLCSITTDFSSTDPDTWFTPSWILLNVSRASFNVIPTRLGTLTFLAFALFTTRSIVVPLDTLESPEGLWAMITPSFLPSTDCCVIFPTTKPKSLSRWRAWSTVKSVKSGTVISPTPLETTRWIVRCSLTFSPAPGVWEITWPAGTSGFVTSLVDTRKCLSSKIFFATETCLPTTLGTSTVVLLQKLP